MCEELVARMDGRVAVRILAVLGWEDEMRTIPSSHTVTPSLAWTERVEIS